MFVFLQYITPWFICK